MRILEALLAILASYVLDTKLINQLLRWEMQLVQLSPIIQELLLERFQKGREEGHKQGHILGRFQEMLKALQKMLAFRFGVEYGRFEKRLSPLNLMALEQLEEAVFTVQSLAEFENLLEQLREPGAGDRKPE